MLYLRMVGSDPEKLCAIEDPLYVLRQRNGVIVRHPYGKRVQGVLSPDGNEIWQFSDRESLGESYAVVEKITMAEYDLWYALQNQPEEPDPEDTDPVIPEDTEPETVMTRAQLTEKVGELDEALNLLLSGVTE
ncbi:MAG: hypothetical protein J6K89_07175 [Oscillospiraceae bacterium]|nr:hypothetical protein [Oscillospiraceae bacterium]